jgi:hypothetical protein
MNALPSQPRPDWTIEQLTLHFGGIPPDRILLDPPPGTANERDLLTLDRKRGFPPELVDGVLIDRFPGFKASVIGAKLLGRLMNVLPARSLGIVIGGSKCPVRLKPGTIRLAAIYFISWEQMPDGKIPNDPISDLVPDLVGEFLTEHLRRNEMDRKRDEFLIAGCNLFWLLNIKHNSVEVSTRQRTLILSADDDLTGGPVLPGFSAPVRDIFELPQQLRP